MSEIARLWVSVKADTTGLTKGLATADRQSAATAKNAERHTKRIGGAWKALAGGFAIKMVGEQVLGFDKAMRNVNSIAKVSEQRFQGLSKSVLHLAGATAQAPTTLAEGLYQIESSGRGGAGSLNILKASAIAATAGLTDTSTATKAVVGALNAYRLKSSQAQEVSDTLFQTVNVGVLSFQDLAQGIGPVLPFADQLGVSLKEVGAATATMTKKGVPAELAFTALKNAFSQMLKPSDALRDAYKKLGVASGEELVRKTGGGEQALQALARSVHGNKEEFQKLFPDIRGVLAAMELTGKNAGDAAKDLKLFGDVGGTTTKVFKEQSKSVSVQWQKLKAEAAAVAAEYGTKLVPALTLALHAVKKMAPLLIAAGAAWAVYKTVALAEIAIVKAASLGLFGPSMKKKLASEAGAAGSSTGKAFAAKAGLAAAAGIAGWEIGSWLRKHSGAVRSAGNAIGKQLGEAVFGNSGDDPVRRAIQQEKDRQSAEKNANPPSPGHRRGNTGKPAAGAARVKKANTAAVKTAKVMASAARKVAASGGSKQQIAATIIAVGEQMGASRQQILAALEAGIVESGLQNLPYGDRDSVGVFQQRPSQGWTGLTNVPKAAQEFFRAAMRVGGKGMTAGQLAQAVQRSAFPGRYDQVQSTALGYLGGGSGGLGGTGKPRRPKPPKTPVYKIPGWGVTNPSYQTGPMGKPGATWKVSFDDGVQSALEHIDLLTFAGKIDEATAKAQKLATLLAVLPLAKGDDALKVQAAINDLQKPAEDLRDAVEGATDEGNLSHFDALTRAGDLTPAAGRQAKIDYLNKQIGFLQSQPALGPEAAEHLLELRGDLKDLLDEAIPDLTNAVNELKDEIKRNTDFATSVITTQNASLTKSIADLISGQIAGYGIAGRALTAGAGSVARY